MAAQISLGGYYRVTLDIGFIGYGFMGKAHANALARLPMFFPETPATNRRIIAGRDRDAVKEAASRFGFEDSTTDWEEVIPEVDVLYNLTPNHLHAEPSIKAVEKGVHVLCEKPLARNLAEAERMAAAARERSVVAGCGYNYRYLPAIQLIKRIVDEQLLGEIRQFRGQFIQDWQATPEDPWTWRNDAELAGSGQIGDLGSHTIDLARWLVGNITGVIGHLQRDIDERPVPGEDEPRPVTTDDAYGAILTFESGTFGVIEGSSIATGHKNSNAIELIGAKGTVRFHSEQLNEIQVKLESNRGFETINVTEDEHPYADAWWPAGHGLGWEHSVIHENREFLRAIETGTEFRPTFDDGRAVQRVVDAVIESHTAERRINLVN